MASAGMFLQRLMAASVDAFPQVLMGAILGNDQGEFYLFVFIETFGLPAEVLYSLPQGIDSLVQFSPQGKVSGIFQDAFETLPIRKQRIFVLQFTEQGLKFFRLQLTKGGDQ